MSLLPSPQIHLLLCKTVKLFAGTSRFMNNPGEHGLFIKNDDIEGKKLMGKDENKLGELRL